MFTDCSPCDFCTHYDDVQICPLIKGGFPSDCDYFNVAFDLGGFEE